MLKDIGLSKSRMSKHYLFHFMYISLRQWKALHLAEDLAVCGPSKQPLLCMAVFAPCKEGETAACKPCPGSDVGGETAVI